MKIIFFSSASSLLLLSILYTEVACRPMLRISPLPDQLLVEQKLLQLEKNIMLQQKLLQNQVQVDLSWEDIQDEVKFYLYTRMNEDTYQELVFNNATSVKDSYINFAYPTTVVVHGYLDSISSDVNQLIKNNLLLREEHNFIGVDWSSLADTIIYTNAAGDVPSVGQYVSQFLNFLLEQGLQLDTLHLIGHSLGAHVAGLAGRNLQLSYQRKIPRITGLDPAKPDFDGDDASGRLDKSDADFVDCIHTCSGELGLGKPVCLADFYPNGVSGYQPGCPWWDVAGICSHSRSYEYYAESIQATHKFESKKCQAVPQNDDAGNCAASPALMGDPATPQYTGDFLVVTNDAYPYSLDIVTSPQASS